MTEYASTPLFLDHCRLESHLRMLLLMKEVSALEMSIAFSVAGIQLIDIYRSLDTAQGLIGGVYDEPAAQAAETIFYVRDHHGSDLELCL